MPTIQEIKQQAEDFYQKDEFLNACPLYLEIWKMEKNEVNGKLLARCYRKSGNYTDAYELHKELASLYPNSGGIKLDKLWLDYNSQIKDWNNANLLQDAEELIKKTDKYNKFTADIHNKTVLSVIKHLIYKGEFSKILYWLSKLDFSTLKTDSFKQNPSDYKRYFVNYAHTLIHLSNHIEKIDSYLSALNFEGIKHAQFKKYIIDSINHTDYNGEVIVSRLRLAFFLKYFMEELLIRKKNTLKNIYNPTKTILISDLGDFEFCPVSFAINETYQIQQNESWDKDEWLGEKKYLLHRYKDFQKSKNLETVFADTGIEISETLQSDFGEIFYSNLVLENIENNKNTACYNETNTIKGLPDYIFETKEGKRFVVTEKFTKRTSETKDTAFYNDLVKVYAYINELTALKIDFGYIIYWYWQIEDVVSHDQIRKKIKVKAYKKFRIENTVAIKQKLTETINRIKEFKQSKELRIDGDKISYPNKCLHCSVLNYCNHKTGKLNLIRLPYNINDLVITKEPKVYITPTDTTKNNNDN